MIKVLVNGYQIPIETSTFPGGEEHIRLKGKKPLDPEVVLVIANITSSKEVMQLMLVTDALRRYAPKANFRLEIPYLPYARQDRVCAAGESFSLKVMCNIINSLEYNEVVVTDCHSEVGLALINNVRHMPQVWALAKGVASSNLAINADVIVAPDAGAAKKAQVIASHYGKPLVQCLKTRVDRDTIEIQVLGDITNKVALVVDDICDGGGTFIALAKELDKVKELNLFVTHGIFSKGKNELLNYYDNIEAYNEFPQQ